MPSEFIRYLFIYIDKKRLSYTRSRGKTSFLPVFDIQIKTDLKKDSVREAVAGVTCTRWPTSEIVYEKHWPVASSHRLQTRLQSKNKKAQSSTCRQALVLTSFQLSVELSMLKQTCLRPLLSRRQHKMFSQLTNTLNYPHCWGRSFWPQWHPR